MKQFLLFVLLLVYSNVYSQDYTENLIDYNSWINAGIVNQPITCWAPGEPGYCGPLPAIGAFSPTSINFSYGLTDLYQLIDIQMALNAAGTGIIITGFNFSFTAKNGNGWDDGRTDYLQAYVDFYNSGNQLLESYNYDLNYQFNWTNFNYTETFIDPYRINQVETVQVGFIGGDNNYWAGFYGPEVTDVNFSLAYGVDQCSLDPLYSPSCPNFQNALLELQCSSDPLSNVNCPGYLEASLALDNTEEVIEEETEIVNDDSEDLLLIADQETFFDEDLDIIEEEDKEETIEEDNSEDIDDTEETEIEIIDLIDDTELENDNIKEKSSTSLLQLALSLIDNSQPVAAAQTTTNQAADQTTKTNTVEANNVVASTTQNGNNTQISSTDTTELDEQLLTKEDTVLTSIAETSEDTFDITETKSTDNFTFDTQSVISDEELLLSNISSELYYSLNTVQDNSTKDTTFVVENEIITESLLNNSDINENVEVAVEQTNKEETNTIDDNIETVILTQPTLNVVSIVSNSNNNIVFTNNTMQQVLAFGGNITEILNTPVPDFSRFEIKPPAQDEQVQTAKVENAVETMSQEEIELEAQQRIGMMDVESQTIALQLMGHKVGFDQYGKKLADQNNWYQNVSVYNNNKLPSGSNLLFGAQDQRYQELISLQYRR